MSEPQRNPFDPNSRTALTVGALTTLISEMLESVPAVWVAGELSNVSRPQSGHYYFTLKDSIAQIRAVMWRGAASRVKFNMQDGLEVVCHGRLEVYAPRGSYQLIVDAIEPRGIGALELALRQLREKLAKEGLFAPERKRPLPKFPRRVAFVTSPTGAAVRDFLQVLARRWRGVQVFVVPTRVQGEGAASEIAKAMALAAEIRPAVDVIVVGRGGGSLEDLWAFNEEPVVRAIANSPVPTISAVGHEIDVTLADLAADVRALTPSEAAELVAPAVEEIMASLGQWEMRLRGALDHRLSRAKARVDSLAQARSLRRPLDGIRLLERRLDDLGARHRRGIAHRLSAENADLARYAGKLEALSPLAVLGRGYSLTESESGGLVVDASGVSPGDILRTRLAKGSLRSQVVEVESDGTRE